MTTVVVEEIERIKRKILEGPEELKELEQEFAYILLNLFNR